MIISLLNDVCFFEYIYNMLWRSGSTSGLPIMFHWSKYLFFFQYHISRLLWLHSKIWNWVEWAFQLCSFQCFVGYSRSFAFSSIEPVCWLDHFFSNMMYVHESSYRLLYVTVFSQPKCLYQTANFKYLILVINKYNILDDKFCFFPWKWIQK